MKKQILTSVLFLFGVITAYSQQLMDMEYTAVPRNYGMRSIVDSCRLSVTYNYVYVTDTTKMSKYYEPMVLEVGDIVNRYYSQNSDFRDSLIFNEYKKKIKHKGHTDGIKGVNWFESDQSTTYIDIYTSPKEGSCSIYTRIGDIDYMYKESIEKLNWHTLPETDTVVGYLCNKAETEFRGHKWYAWFAMEIPYNFGPWKLGGLPGMILKAEDSEGLFSWTAIEIGQPKNRSIYNYIVGSEQICKHVHTIVKCKRKDVDKLWKRRWVNPMSIYFTNRTKAIYKKVGSKFVELKVDIYARPDKYYPKLELDI